MLLQGISLKIRKTPPDRTLFHHSIIVRLSACIDDAIPFFGRFLIRKRNGKCLRDIQFK